MVLIFLCSKHFLSFVVLGLSSLAVPVTALLSDQTKRTVYLVVAFCYYCIEKMNFKILLLEKD
jgi:hypothetical protein